MNVAPFRFLGRAGAKPLPNRPCIDIAIRPQAFRRADGRALAGMVSGLVERQGGIDLAQRTLRGSEGE